MTGETLVTAATGTVGRHVVAELAADGVTTRAASREPARARRRFGPNGPADCPTLSGDAPVSFVEFDYERPETWGPALEGVSAVFLVFVPQASDGFREFLAAAGRVGARVAYLSTLGAGRNPLLPHFWNERRVRAAAPNWTLLRASFFTQNLHEVHGDRLRETGEIAVPAGDGATSFVDARDVGAAAAAVLSETGHDGRTYDLTGPAALTYDELAARASRVTDREIDYTDPSPVAFLREARERHGLGFATLQLGIYTVARLGLAARVTDDLRRLLDREPYTVDDYFEAYRPVLAAEGAPDHSL